MDFLTTAVAAVLIVAAHTPNGRRKVLLSLLVGLVWFLLARVTGPFLDCLMWLFFYSGIVAILIEAAIPYVKRGSGSSLPQMLFVPGLIFSSGLALFLGQKLTAITLDRFLYVFDGSLGFQPGFVAARFLYGYAWLNYLAALAYVTLPITGTFVWVALDKRRPAAGRRFAISCVALGVFGWICYCIFPAVGSPIAMAASFPRVTPTIALSDVVPTVAPPGNRNCMPSLHTAWVIVIWWYSSGLRLPHRAILAVWLVLTLASTLANHYFIDMALAVPFVVAVDAGVANWRHHSHLALRITAMCSALFFAWLLGLRFGIKLLLLSPLVSWSAVFATMVWCWALRRQLERDRAEPEIEPVLRNG